MSLGYSELYSVFRVFMVSTCRLWHFYFNSKSSILLISAWNLEYVLDSGSSSPFRYDVETLDHSLRQRRDVIPPPTLSPTASSPNLTQTQPVPVPSDPAPTASNTTSSNATPGSNKTANATEGK